MTSIVISMQTAVENTLADPRIVTSFSEISAIRKRIAELREEALGWHHIADEKDKEIAHLQSIIRQNEINIAALNQKVTDLSIENVKLLNKDASKLLRDYDHEQMPNNKRKRNVGS